MKGFAWTGKGQAGWIEKESPVIGPLDAKVRPLAVAASQLMGATAQQTLSATRKATL